MAPGNAARGNAAETGAPASELGVVRHFDAIEWVDEAKFGRVSADVVGEAQRAGARRKFLNRGDEGLYVQYSTMPAGFRIAPHSHSHGEVLYILRGGCTVEPSGEQLGADDSAVIPGGHEYGFTCGPDGMEFLTIRPGDAQTSFTASA
jgi:quercetin dioxygenase-like cupin family protein